MSDVPLRHRRRQLAANLLTLVGSLTVTLLALEGGIRIFSDEGSSLFLKDATVGHHYVPGFAGRRFIPEAGHDVFLRFNRLGYRGPDRDFAKPQGVRRIVVLGDSFTASVGVEEPDTMVAQLEARLNTDHPGARWEVLSFGVGGYSTAQSLLTWRHVASRFAPDVVILCFFVGNDPLDNSRRLSSYYRPYFDLDARGELVYRPMSTARASLNAWLDEHSRLYVWEKEKTRVLRDRFQRGLATRGVKTISRTAQIFDPRPSGDMEEAWRLTSKLLATLHDEVEASGARFVLVTIPAYPQVNDAAWQRLVETGGSTAERWDRDYPEQRLADVARVRGIRLLSLAPAFRGAPNPDDLNFHEFHWNANGNRLASETIEAYLRTQELVPSPPSRSGPWGWPSLRR